MLTNRDVRQQLGELAVLASRTGKALERADGLPAPALAAAFVESAKLVERLDRLAGRVRAAAAPPAEGPGGDGQESPPRRR
jgi:hypothetical protein